MRLWRAGGGVYTYRDGKIIINGECISDGLDLSTWLIYVKMDRGGIVGRRMKKVIEKRCKSMGDGVSTRVAPNRRARAFFLFFYFYDYYYELLFFTSRVRFHLL